MLQHSTHRKPSDRRRKAGFTLTELLVSLGVLSIVCVATFGIFSQGMTAWSKIMERTRMIEDTRTVFNTISHDLVSATIGTWPDVFSNQSALKFYLRNNSLAFGTYSLDNDTLAFVTNNFSPKTFAPTTDYSSSEAGLIGEVKYEVMRLSGSTYTRRVAADLSDIKQHELVRSVDCPPDFAYMDESGGTPTYRAHTPLGFSIISFNVQLYRNAAGGWLSTWTYSALPEAVRVELGVRKNYKKYYDNLVTANQQTANFMDRYYIIVELPTRDRTT